MVFSCAVMAEAPADFLQLRRQSRRGYLGRDVGGGVAHAAGANIEHQDFEYQLEAWIRTHWAHVRGRRVYHGVNLAPLGGWPDNYRIPDVVLLAEDCAAKTAASAWKVHPPW